MVFSALCEYGFIWFLKFNEKELCGKDIIIEVNEQEQRNIKVKVSQIAAIAGNGWDAHFSTNHQGGKSALKGSGNEKPLNLKKIDQYSLIRFPLAFIVFNMSYWIIYLNNRN